MVFLAKKYGETVWHAMFFFSLSTGTSSKKCPWQRDIPSHSWRPRRHFGIRIMTRKSILTQNICSYGSVLNYSDFSTGGSSCSIFKCWTIQLSFWHLLRMVHLMPCAITGKPGTVCNLHGCTKGSDCQKRGMSLTSLSVFRPHATTSCLTQPESHEFNFVRKLEPKLSQKLRCSGWKQKKSVCPIWGQSARSSEANLGSSEIEHDVFFQTTYSNPPKKIQIPKRMLFCGG